MFRNFNSPKIKRMNLFMELPSYIMYYDNYNSQTSLVLLSYSTRMTVMWCCAQPVSDSSVCCLFWFCLWQTTLAVHQDFTICKIYHIVYYIHCNCITSYVITYSESGVDQLLKLYVTYTQVYMFYKCICNKRK